MSWSLKFDEPIVLSNARKLATLKEADTYITELPRAEHDAPEWQAAMGPDPRRDPAPRCSPGSA
jgi:hypothetical protein